MASMNPMISGFGFESLMAHHVDASVRSTRARVFVRSGRPLLLADVIT